MTLADHVIEQAGTAGRHAAARLTAADIAATAVDALGVLAPSFARQA